MIKVSYGEELLLEMEINEATNYIVTLQLVANEWWKTKNGKLIRISDMTNTHLVNTINMLRRQIDGSAHDDYCWDYITAMEDELRKRGIKYGENRKC